MPTARNSPNNSVEVTPLTMNRSGIRIRTSEPFDPSTTTTLPSVHNIIVNSPASSPSNQTVGEEAGDVIVVYTTFVAREDPVVAEAPTPVGVAKTYFKKLHQIWVSACARINRLKSTISDARKKVKTVKK